MAEEFDRLVPEEFRKIAQNDSVTGQPISAVFHCKEKNSFFIKTIQAKADGDFISMTFGPIPAHAFYSLMHIMVDVESMDKRYYYLD